MLTKELIGAMRTGTAEDICRAIDALMEGDWDGLEPVDAEASIARVIVAARDKPEDADLTISAKADLAAEDYRLRMVRIGVILTSEELKTFRDGVRAGFRALG
jgi:hypothetical protein